MTMTEAVLAEITKVRGWDMAHHIGVSENILRGLQQENPPRAGDLRDALQRAISSPGVPVLIDPGLSYDEVELVFRFRVR